MRKWSLISLAFALGLSGCAHFVKQPDPARPQVFVVEGRLIVVNAEPLVFTRRGEVTITWHLPKGSNYTFPETQGIVIDGELVRETRVVREGLIVQTHELNPNQKEVGACATSRDRKEVSCVNRNSRPGKYKYTIRVRDGSELKSLDPWVVNE